jgi:hypothetical protein
MELVQIHAHDTERRDRVALAKLPIVRRQWRQVERVLVVKLHPKEMTGRLIALVGRTSVTPQPLAARGGMPLAAELFPHLLLPRLARVREPAS